MPLAYYDGFFAAKIHFFKGARFPIAIKFLYTISDEAEDILDHHADFDNFMVRFFSANF